jgi:hypothetical protein
VIPQEGTGMPSDKPAWKAVGDLLIRRRSELDPRYRNRRLFTGERGVEYRMVNAIERGERSNYEPGTLSALEVAYELPAGAIMRAVAAHGQVESLTAGPEPVPRERTLTPLHAGVDETLLAGHLAEVQGALLDAIARTGSPDPPAGEIFADEDEREIWKRSAHILPSGRPLLDQNERVRLIAVRRMVAAENRAAGLSNDFITSCWHQGGRVLIPDGSESVQNGA